MTRANATDVWLSVSHASVRICSIGVRLKIRTVSVGPSHPMPPAGITFNPARR